METLTLHVIAHIYNDFKDKFGIPRQSMLVDNNISKIIFEPTYRVKEAFRGMEEYSHLWLIWEFSKAVRDDWSPTVRPPKLGGNKRVGVFATRSPYRPNPLGLSSVKLHHIEFTEKDGPVLYVTGADLLDGTPIYDIKPYLPYTDAHGEATESFAKGKGDIHMEVVLPDEIAVQIPEEKRQTVISLLKEDPRPGYQNDPNRIYKMIYGNFELSFTVNEDILTVTDILFL